MKIYTRECATYSNFVWTEVIVTEDNTTIKFDVRDNEKLELAEHLADTAFDLMPDMKTMFNYLQERGHLDAIVSMAADEEEVN